MNTVIDHLINAESNRASDSATRGTVKMRVFLKIARLMGISLQTIYDTQHLVRIDPSLSKAIEILWNGGSPIEMDSLNQNWITHEKRPVLSSEDEELLQKFLAKDFAKPADISKILSALEKRFVESNQFRRELGYVFAADGVLDDGPICFERYSDHLAIPKTLGEPIDDDHPNEEPVEAHVRAVRTIYRDVKYVTPERIGATLKRLLKVETADDPPKRRGDNRSSASSENSSGGDDDSSSSGSGDDHWQDHYDKYIADQYKKLVGKKINLIIQWMRERFRRRKDEEVENLRKRTIATKRKRVTFESTDPNTLIKDMAKKSQPDSQTESKDPHTTMTEPEKVISSAAATVTTVVAVTESDPKPILKKKKKTKPKKSEETEGTKRKKSEKITQSKKVKKATTDEVEKETRNNEEVTEKNKIETIEAPAEAVTKCDKESDDNGSETKEIHE